MQNGLLPVLAIVVIVTVTSGCMSQSYIAPQTTFPAGQGTPPAENSSSPTGSPSFSSETVPDMSLDIPIKGDASCSLQTGQALTLLKSRDPSDYRNITRYIRLIECRDAGSGMYAWEEPPRFAAGRATRDAGILWYAGAIAHDSCHSREYHEYLQSHPSSSVPPEVYTGKTAEEACLQYQYTVLQKIGANEKMLQYVKDSAGTEYWNESNVWW
jgi:hypothetical protein